MPIDKENILKSFEQNFISLTGRKPSKEELDFASRILSSVSPRQKPSPIVSTFTADVEELRKTLGVEKPRELPEISPQSILQDVEKLREETKRYLELQKQTALEEARRELETSRPLYQQLLATLNNIGGFSQEWFDRLRKSIEDTDLVLTKIRETYDLAIAQGNLEAAEKALNLKIGLLENLIKERNAYTNTIANLFNTVAELRTLPYKEQEIKMQAFTRGLEGLLGAGGVLRNILFSRIGKIKTEADLSSSERTILRLFSSNVANVLGADEDVVYQQLFNILKKPPEISKIQTIAGDDGVLVITIDEMNNVNYEVIPFAKKSTTALPISSIFEEIFGR